MWCLIHVLVRFFASTCGSGAVPFAPRRAGCLVLARWSMWWGVVSLRHMGRARCLRQPPWNFHGGWRVPAVRLVGFVRFRFLAETRPGDGGGFGLFGLGWLVPWRLVWLGESGIFICLSRYGK